MFELGDKCLKSKNLILMNRKFYLAVINSIYRKYSLKSTFNHLSNLIIYLINQIYGMLMDFIIFLYIIGSIYRNFPLKPTFNQLINQLYFVFINLNSLLLSLTTFTTNSRI